MDCRSLSLVVITVGVASFVNFGHTNPIFDSLESSSEISKVFLDCKHSDYRTYIQCLKKQKRDKRHHGAEMDHSCMESCIPDCVKDRRPCNEVCMHCINTSKKTKHHTINITETEYETECISGNCTKVSPHKPVVVNVTNEIHIHNYYNKTVDTPKWQTPTTTHCPCYYIIWQPCYCRPQLPICQYQQQWPCIPYGGTGGMMGGMISGIGGGIVGGGIGGGIVGGGIGGGIVGPMVGTMVGQSGNTCTCGNEATTCDECNPAAG